MSDHVQWDELEQLRLVLREDSFLEDCKQAVSEHVTTLVFSKEVAFVFMEVNDTLAKVAKKLH